MKTEVEEEGERGRSGSRRRYRGPKLDPGGREGGRKGRGREEGRERGGGREGGRKEVGREGGGWEEARALLEEGVTNLRRGWLL